MIHIECPSCGSPVRAQDQHAGLRARCPECREGLIVPAPGGSPPSPALPAAQLDPLDPDDSGAAPRPVRSPAPRRRYRPSRPERSGLGASTAALAAAAGAAVAGALIWAGIGYVAHLEIGFVAWGIGALVGGAARGAGGRGGPVGMTAAALTLASIAGGKLICHTLLFDQVMTEVLAEDREGLRALYEELSVDAEIYRDLRLERTSDRELREFMVLRDYSAANSSIGVTPQELSAFRSYSEPILVAMVEQEMGFDRWAEELLPRMVTDAREQFSAVDSAVLELEPVDFLFIFLGTTTALGIVYGGRRRERRGRLRGAR